MTFLRRIFEPFPRFYPKRYGVAGFWGRQGRGGRLPDQSRRPAKQGKVLQNPCASLLTRPLEQAVFFSCRRLASPPKGREGPHTAACAKISKRCGSRIGACRQARSSGTGLPQLLGKQRLPGSACMAANSFPMNEKMDWHFAHVECPYRARGDNSLAKSGRLRRLWRVFP